MGDTGIVTETVLQFNLGFYWLVSMLFLTLMDQYAKKKIGRVTALGYKILRAPRFFSMIIVSAYTMILLIWSRMGLEVTNSTLTYLGLPYFIVWTFFLVNVLRRVKAETKGRPWAQ